MLEEFDGMNQWGLRGSGDQLKDFIFRLQEEKFARGERRREQISTLEELRAHREEMRRRFLEGLGGLVEAAGPLRARVTGKREEKEFTLESIIFNSYSNIYVTASLYLPRGVSFPGPAVLFVCGHSENGRMYDDYSVVCQTLVRAGLIVFAIDPPGQGERSNFYDPEKGEYLVPRACDDHDSCGTPAVATGMFLARYFLCDSMRAVDYMLTRPEIDPERIGITGNSGGGTQTLAMMACDDRIAAAAPGTFVTTRREIMYSGQPQDSEQIWPGTTEFGFDHVTAFLIFAPRPAAILAVDYDFFPIEGTLETFEAAKRFYGMYGREEGIRLYRDRDTHRYTQPLAVHAAEFFTEVFLGKKATVANADIGPLPERVMTATVSGNVKGEVPGAGTLPEQIQEVAARLREERLALPEEARRARARQWLLEKVGKGRKPMAFHVRMLRQEDIVDAGWKSGTEDGAGAEGCLEIGAERDAEAHRYRCASLSWWTQRRLICAGNLIKAVEYSRTERLPTVIAIWPEGTRKISRHAPWIGGQCEAGRQVLVLDVPGAGSLEQYPLIQGMPYRERFGTLYRLCSDLIYSGDSMAAMRCYDVLRAMEMLETEFGIEEQDITLYCQGPDGVYGIMAGFLREKVRMEYGDGLLLNVEKEVIGQEVFCYDDTLSRIIPGMLRYFDYEELIKRRENR